MLTIRLDTTTSATTLSLDLNNYLRPHYSFTREVYKFSEPIPIDLETQKNALKIVEALCEIKPENLASFVLDFSQKANIVCFIGISPQDIVIRSYDGWQVLAEELNIHITNPSKELLYTP